MNRYNTLLRQALMPYTSLLSRLKRADFPLRIVGGAIRDALLGRAIIDFDFAAQCSFEQLEKFCDQQADKIVTKNKKYNNIKILIDKHFIDITLLRQDKQCDGRHATIQMTHDWLADAQRRDFTINALYATIDGQIEDPLAAIGQSSINDIYAQHLRFIGQADQRIHEDYLRILRYFRFAAQLGLATHDTELQAINRLKHCLPRLSPERIRQEWQKILLGEHCLPVLRQMQNLSLGQQFLSHHHWNLDALERLLKHSAQSHTQADFIVRLAALLFDHAQYSITPEQAARWCLSRREYRQLRVLQQPVKTDIVLNQAEAHRWLYQHGRSISQQRCLLHLPTPQEFYHLLQHSTAPIFPLNGTMLLEMGYPSQKIGQILKNAKEYWLQYDMKPDVAAIIDHIKIYF